MIRLAAGQRRPRDVDDGQVDVDAATLVAASVAAPLV